MSDVEELAEQIMTKIAENYKAYLEDNKLEDTNCCKGSFYKGFAAALVEDPLEDIGVQLILLEHLGRMSAMFYEASDKEVLENIANIVNKPF